MNAAAGLDVHQLAGAGLAGRLRASCSHHELVIVQCNINVAMHH
jgi:hypothetical protein